MQITPDQLAAICGYNSRVRFLKFEEPLNETLQKYDISTRLRVAAFIAQVAHESGNFYFLRELASGKDYEGRKDLGNIVPGDGPRYKGRGLIQITGRSNYAQLSKAFGIDFIAEPEKLEEPRYACLSAGWFWNRNDLNTLADEEKFKLITRRINGGLNGYADRLAHYEKALEVLNGS